MIENNSEKKQKEIEITILQNDEESLATAFFIRDARLFSSLKLSKMGL